jgi:hypothetical protein
MTECCCPQCRLGRGEITFEEALEINSSTRRGTKEQPSVGRVVHYVAYGTPGGEFPAGAHRAAVITEVEDEGKHIVSLCVMNPTGLFFNQHIKYDSTVQMPGTWHWPEIV